MAALPEPGRGEIPLDAPVRRRIATGRLEPYDIDVL
jgi:hypothetical protein